MESKGLIQLFLHEVEIEHIRPILDARLALRPNEFLQSQSESLITL